MKVSPLAALLCGGGTIVCGLLGYNSFSNDPRMFLPPADSWYRAPTNAPAVTTGHSHTLSKAEFYVAAPATQVVAFSLLQRRTIVPLSFAQAKFFCSGEISHAMKQGVKPYLVRAVAWGDATRGYFISSTPKYLCVEQGTLGSSPGKMQRQALVVFLAYQPWQEFATCSSAE